MSSSRPAKVVIYRDLKKDRSKRIVQAWQAGLKVQHVPFVTRNSDNYNGQVEAEIAIFYGLRERLWEVFQTYKTKATAVYVDLGYWDRKPRHDKLGGHHKLAVNDLHPTAYFRKGHSPSRFERFGVRVRPWHGTGKHIIVAGMSDKSARVNGFGAEEWERWAVNELKKHTDRPIWYRPKPSWPRARPIAGTTFNKAGLDVRPHLKNCWAVVTHHSNAAVDAIAEGIPTYCEEGVASVMSMPSLSAIENPPEPDDREGFLADVAYTQWSVAEMATGKAWRYLVNEGLV